MVKQTVIRVTKMQQYNNDKNKGVFITFEGIEGAGKTTNIEYIANQIKKAGYDVLLTREPGGTPIGESIREILISKNLPDMHPETELLLMFAARAEHINTVIRPALEKKMWVLCDRFTDASYAYQGAGRGLDMHKIDILKDFVQGSLKPDITFLFDLPANIGLARAKSRGEADRFEQQHVDFFNRIRNQYLRLAEKEPERFRLIHAEHNLEQVQQQIKIIMEPILNQRKP